MLLPAPLWPTKADIAPPLISKFISLIALSLEASYLNNWKKKNWLSSSKKPVKNKDLWIILDSLVLLHKIEWIWVKGHSGHFENDRADFLANLGVGEASK